MPRVKIDYIVSFSGEDPEHPASNLLSLEINKKKWLCKSGETSCSVVFQLTKAVEISSVQIGGSQVALVEVLVGRSETPGEPFQVLVPSSVFLSPSDSRRGAAGERVRTFAREQLAARGRFDRVRVVCSQPYNKHCKFGLSFIHIYEPESHDKTSRKPEINASNSIPQSSSISKPAADSISQSSSTSKPTGDSIPQAESTSKLNNSSFMLESEDEEEFTPGELFAKHSQNNSQNTESQIRQATSQALKNISDSSTKLTKTPINKNYKKPFNPDVASSSRDRNDVIYTDDDDKPHAKIDRIVNRHKDEKSKENESKIDDKKCKENQSKERKSDKKEVNRSEGKIISEANGDVNRTKKGNEASTSHRSDRDNKKRRHSDERHDNGLRPGPAASLETLLSDVTFAISGYENPRRARVRQAACAMGARYMREWTPECTHLICAFPNTPKLRAVRSAHAACSAVTAAWVEQCFAARRRLPAGWFATEPHFRVDRPKDFNLDSDCDTDDEIDKVLQKQKKQKTDRSPTRRDKSPSRSDKSPTRRNKSPTQRDKSPSRRDKSPIQRDKSNDNLLKSPSHTGDKQTPGKEHRNTSVKSRDRTTSPARDVTMHDASGGSDDVAFVKDERFQGNITVPSSDSDTEPEGCAPTAARVDSARGLPELFRDVTFLVHAATAAPRDVTAMRRYIRAYGGLVLEESDLEEDSAVDYIISTEVPPPGRRCVAALSPAWLWRCHEEKALVDVEQYRLR